ncbi:MAG: DUF362 domain-containing protein [Myxococcales bacterium]|nr:DUF362 domain-containing protein [Myxococcales bacterium]
MKIPKRPTVIIRSCPTYDTAAIERIIGEGLETLDVTPYGRTLVKPNLVAAGEFFPHAHTRPEFGEGVLRALRDRGGEQIEELAVGERCGITIPTRMAFRDSGFSEMIGRLGGIKHYYFEESSQVEIPLTHPQRLRDYVFTPEPVAQADFFVNLPKFKAHPWTTVTFSMKNYIGIQDDRHRLIDHDHRLNEKVADLQHIIQPQFIAIDAITAGEGRMLTPTPRDLGLIIMGNSQVAFDSVCCHIIGIDPLSVDHIRLTSEYGFGSTDLADIDVTGDVPLEEAQDRAKGFEVGLIRVKEYFEGTSISAYAGPPPDEEHSNYCWGGCPGSIEEAIEILRQYDEETDEKMPRLHVVFGNYKGDIGAGPGEKVVFIGDCCQWQGKLDGDLVQIKSTYTERAAKDPHEARHDDIYSKMLSINSQMGKARKATHVRIEGCPVSVAEQALALVHLGKLKNPYLDPSQAIAFNKSYLSWRGRTTLNRLMGKKYQRHGSYASRGQAQPELPKSETDE